MDDEGPQKKCDGGTGAPMWVVTFADLATLLMCFFVLILSFSELDLIKYKQIAGSLSEAFGVQRDLKTKEAPRGVNLVAREFSPGRPKPTPLNVVKQNTTNNLRQYLKLQPEEAEKKERELERQRRARAQAEQEAAQQEEARLNAAKIRAALREEIQSGQVQVHTERRKIIIRIRERGTFTSGSAELITSFMPTLRKIGNMLATIPGRVVVAGHTDNVPIRTSRFRSNWELSASRAVSVVHALLQSASLSQQRFEVTGYGDTRPLTSNASAAGRSRNRRVELMVVRGRDDSGGELGVVDGETFADANPQDMVDLMAANNAVLDKFIHQYEETSDRDMLQWLVDGLTTLLSADGEEDPAPAPAPIITDGN